MLFTAPVCFSAAYSHVHPSCTPSFQWLCEGRTKGGVELSPGMWDHLVLRILERPWEQQPCGPRLSGLQGTRRGCGFPLRGAVLPLPFKAGRIRGQRCRSQRTGSMNGHLWSPGVGMSLSSRFRSHQSTGCILCAYYPLFPNFKPPSCFL